MKITKAMRPRTKGSNYKSFMLKKIFVILIIFSLVITGYTSVEFVKAATGSQVNVAIDYINETARVTAGTGGSNKFYISIDKKKTWELLDESGYVDISTLLSTKTVDVSFKGNLDTEPKTETLPAQDTSLKVSYSVTNGIGKITYTTSVTGGAVEYRIGQNGIWKTAMNNMPTAIYEIKGVTLQFRTPATTTAPAGKAVNLKISKRPTAPSVKLDGSKLYISGLKSGETQYRVGNNTAWTTFTATDSKVKYITLTTLLLPGAAGNIATPAGSVEFRTIGNDKKVYSSVKLIDIPAQPAYPNNIAIFGTTLTVTDTNTKKQYEYTRVEKGSTFNINTAKWTAMTSKSPVVVKNASVGDVIYVRAKSYTDSATKTLVLASAYYSFTVSTVTTSTTK